MLPTNNFHLYNSNFTGHSYINITFGLAEQIFNETTNAKISIGDSNVHFGIKECTFDKYISNSAIYMEDISTNIITD